MVAPSGCCGVHAVPKAGQSCGFFRPRRISPLMQTGDSLVCTPCTSKSRSASYARYSGRSAYPLRGMLPMPRHLRSTISKTSKISARAARLPSRPRMRLYSFSTSWRPDSSCCTVIRIPCSRSIGSKPVMTIGTRNSAAIGSYSA